LAELQGGMIKVAEACLISCSCTHMLVSSQQQQFPFGNEFKHRYTAHIVRQLLISSQQQ